MIPLQLTERFFQLPSYSDNLFKALWLEGKLCYGTNQSLVDEIDLHNAQLVCETINRRRELLIVLPDFFPHRPSMLLASTLLYSSPYIRGKNPNQSNFNNPSSILYFGTNIGIREQLAQVKIRGSSVKLTEAFRQSDVSRSGAVRNTKVETSKLLPQIITIYAPANPSSVIDKYNPSCVAIDLDDAPRAEWLKTLLVSLSTRQIPIVAWSQNALSDCVTVFKQFGESVIWSPRFSVSNQKNERNQQSTSEVTTQFQSYILENTESSVLSDLFQQIAQKLLPISRQSFGQLGLDAIKQHWHLTRSLESLAVPLDFYESEAENFWGLKTFEQMRKSCEHFRQASLKTYPQLVEQLEEVSSLCDEIFNTLTSKEPPLWSAICNLCVNKMSDAKQILIFSGRSRKELFLLAMLAYHNFSEEDLEGIGIHVLTFDELRADIKQKYITGGTKVSSLSEAVPLNQQILLVGLPSRQLNGRLLPILWHDLVEVLIYPHQVQSLRSRINEIERYVSFDVNAWYNTLSSYIDSNTKNNKISSSPSRVRFCHPQILMVETAKRQHTASIEKLLQIGSSVEEIERVLKIEEDLEDDLPTVHQPQQEERSGSVELWCEQAVRVNFSGNSSITYPADEIINVVRKVGENYQVKERFVRSLRPKDCIVFIQNQRRQSFYQLLISRLHQNPSIILHLSLISRWQRDFAKAYSLWSKRGTKNLDKLLELMQIAGSKLTSSMALRFWLQGKVLCPDDQEDLHRLAEILSMNFVAEKYKNISQAASRLSGLHRGMANKLNRWLTAQAAGSDLREDDEIIDPELNLTFGDLRSSLMLLEVSYVEPMTGLWLRSELGKLEN